MSTRKSTIFYGVLLVLTSLVVGMVIASRLDLAPGSFAGTLTVPPSNSEPITGPLDATTFRTIAQEASPTVVSIFTTRRQTGGGIIDLFGFRDRSAPEGPGALVSSAGSGFIVDAAGHILTNNHVVADAEEIEIKFAGMDELSPGLPAEIVGRDELTDTALVRLTTLPKDRLVPSRFGDSGQIAPGDWVMAIGNPFGLSNTVTIGVISAVGRLQQAAVQGRFEEMIQTDAAINRGNSGGPLLNIRGEVVGMNTMIISDQTGGNIGIGFAVPINTIRDILPQLRTGRVVRGRIGVTVLRQPMTEQYAKDLGLARPGGAEVSTVDANGPAGRAGLKVGDVIVEFDGKPVRDNNELVSMVTRTTPGTTVPVRVIRDRQAVTLQVTVEELNLAQEQAGLTRPQAERGQPTDTGFGMTIQEITPRIARDLQLPAGRGGAVVTSVEPGGAAARALLQRGDVIVRVGGSEVRTVDDVSTALDAIPSGATARLVVWRGGQEALVLIRKR